jgi:hypothetical protein
MRPIRIVPFCLIASFAAAACGDDEGEFADAGVVLSSLPDAYAEAVCTS